MNLDLYLTTHSKLNLRWIININVKAKLSRRTQGSLYLQTWSRQRFLHRVKKKKQKKKSSTCLH